MKMMNKLLLITFLAMLLVVVGCNKESGKPVDEKKETESEDKTSDKDEEVEDEEEASDGYGGEIKVAINAQPPTLDPHMTTAGATSDTSKMAFEALLTVDSKYNHVPMLAEKVEASDDNKEFTFYLRKGIKFHNGKEMTSEDVVASMNRWIEKSGIASGTFGDAKFEAIDDSTVKVELAESSSIALGVLASNEQYAAIMPKEVIESADVEGVTEIIGTGPYKFVEWKQDQYIHFTRYEDYQPVDLEADGISGKKEAFLDDVYYYIVTDPSTRLAGVQSGEYDIAYSLPSDNYEQLMNTPGIHIETRFTATMDLLYNKRGGLMENPKMRQAVNAALNIDEILTASLVNNELYSADAGYMNTDIEQWDSDAGKEYYNINDPEKAKALFDEAGYNGESIVLMTTRDYEHYYNASVVIKEQLEKIGVKAELEVYDWPTIVDRREKPDTWDLFVNAFPFKSDPTQLLQLNPAFAGGINDTKADELINAIRTATSQEDAKKYWDELQEYAWSEYVPMTRLGSFGGVTGVSDRVEGFEVVPGGTVLWNATIADK